MIKNVQSGFTHNSRKLETNVNQQSGEMDNGVCSHDGILNSHEQEQTSGHAVKWINPTATTVSGSSQAQKSTHHDPMFIKDGKNYSGAVIRKGLEGT